MNIISAAPVTFLVPTDESKNVSPEENISIFPCFLQSPFWAAFKGRHGWQPYFFRINAEKEDLTPVSFYCLVLLRNFSRFGSIAYVPMGPPVETKNDERYRLLKKISDCMVSFLPAGLLCFRFDPPWESDENTILAIDNSAYRQIIKAPADIQPPDTVILNLLLSEETLLKQMKSKWRYNIRLAEKKGVAVRRSDARDIEIFYSLYRETSIRDGIAIHDKEYYESLLLMPQEEISVRLYIAEYEKEPLAAIITLFSPREAVYLYGASSDNNRNLMPSYLLQWTAICDARKYGSIQYDFYGIPPTDDENHPMHGLYRFKTGFGGTIVHRIGSWDVPCAPLKYRIYCFLEKARTFWFKRVKKLFINRKKGR